MLVINYNEIDLRKEEWKTLYIGNKWTYEASNMGRFRRIGKTKYCYLKPYYRNCYEYHKKIGKQNNRQHTLIIKITPNIDKKPIEINCKKVLAELFIRPLKENEVVITKNGNNEDLRVKNLFITTKSNLGKITGYKCSQSKRVYYYDNTGYRHSFRSARECSKQLGVSYQTILDYCYNRVKKPKFKVRWADSLVGD
jgi:hypothetical protein